MPSTIRKNHFRAVLSALAIAFVTALAGSAQAATYTYSGAQNTMNQAQCPVATYDTVVWNITSGYFGTSGARSQTYANPNLTFTAVAQNNGWGEAVTRFTSATTVTGAGAFSLITAGLGQDYVFAGNMTGYSGNVSIADSGNATLSLGNTGSSVVQYGGETAGGNKALGTVTGTSPDRTIANVAGTGSLTVNNVVFNYATDATYDYVTVANAIAQRDSVNFIGNASILATGVISGAGVLNKSDTGTLTLSGNNTYSGATTISAGTLRLGHANALGTTAAGTTVNSGGALDLNGLAIGAEGLTLNGTGVSSGGALINSSGTAASLSGAISLATASSVGGIGNSTLSGVISGTVGLTKVGAGTVTLNNADTYSGVTTISGGTLALGASGSIVSTPTITVASGGVFDVSASSFALGGSQTLVAGRTSGFATDVNGTLSSGGTINPAANGTKGTLTVAGGVSLTGGTLNLDLTGGTFTVGGGVNDHVSGSGALNLSGSTTVNVTWTGSPVTGTYEIIGCASLGSGGTANLVEGTGLTDGARISFSFDTTTTPGKVFLVVSGGPAPLTWVGGFGGNAWDIGTTANWTNNTTLLADNFYDLDTVTFNDTSANGAVSLGVTVSPGSVTVNNSSTAYSLTGAGKITGTTTLAKSGTSTLTVATANDNSGATTISGGTVVVADGGALGSGAVVNNAALQLDNASALTFNNAVSGTGGLTKTSAGTATVGGVNTYDGNTTISAGTLKLGAGSPIPNGAGKGNVSVTGTLDLGGAGETINGLSGSGTVDNSTGAGTVTLTVGDNDQTSTFGGVIQNTSGTMALTKTGTGTLTLNGANTHAGTTTIGAGSVVLGNATALGSTTGGAVVSSGAALDLNGQTVGAEGLTLNGTGISSGGALINSSGTAASLSGNITLGSASSVGGSGNTTLSGNISGSSSLTKTGTGTVTLGGANTTWTAGTFTLDGGGVTLTEPRALAGTAGANGRATVIKSGTLDLAYTGTANQWTTSLVSGNSAIRLGNLTMGGTAGATSALTASGSPDIGFGLLGGFSTTFTYDAANNGGTATIAARWISAGTSTEGTSVLNIGDSTATTVEVDFTGAINATGQTDGYNFRLRKTGAGALRISAANFLPKVTVTAGKLIVNHANALGASRTGDGGSANLVTVDGGTLDLNGFSPSVGGLQDGGVTTGVIRNDGGAASTLTVGSSGASTTYGGLIENGVNTVALAKTGTGDLTLSGINTYTGGTTISQGVLRVANSDSAVSTGDITFAGNSTLSTASGGGARSLANNITINSGVTASTDGGFFTLTLGGVISGAGSLTTASINTTELNGANTYGGDTTVIGGTTLKLGASASIANSPIITANGTFDVASVSGGFTLGAAQTLKGNGTVNGAVTANGTIAPGTSIGTLTLNNSPTLSGTTLMELDKSASPATNDLLVVSGNPLTFAGTLTVQNTGPALVGGESFDLFNATSLSGSFSATNMPSLGADLNWWFGQLMSDGKVVVNRAPTAAAGNYSRAKGVSLKIPISSVLALTSDADSGDSVAFQGVDSGGQGATVTTNATYIFYSPANHNNDTLNYTVRDTQGGSKSASLAITVTNSVGALYITNNFGGSLTVSFYGIPGYDYSIQRSSNLVDWLDVVTITAPANSGLVQFTETPPHNPAFYRTRQP